MRQLTLFSIIAFLISFLSSAHAAISNDQVANINGKVITKSEFERRYKENIKYFRFTPPTKKNVLLDMIRFELGVQEAKRLGLDKKPEVRDRMNNVLYQALVDNALSGKFKKIKVSDKDVVRYCKQYPEVRTSHVYVPLGPTALPSEEKNAYKKIRAALAQLKKGKSFESVVAHYSEGYARKTGGDIDFQMKDKLDPVYYSSAKKLKIGQFTRKPIRSQLGLHIIKLTAIRSCSDINKAEWNRMIFDEKRTKIFEDYLGKLRNNAKVQINEKLLKDN